MKLIVKGLSGGVVQLALYAMEEVTLRETLPNYGVYVARVPYRLVPLLW